MTLQTGAAQEENLQPTTSEIVRHPGAVEPEHPDQVSIPRKQKARCVLI
jgi:hypothetical protein